MCLVKLIKTPDGCAALSQQKLYTCTSKGYCFFFFNLKWASGREGRREGGRKEEGREGRREGGRKEEGREEGREGGREEGRDEGRKERKIN